MRKFLLSIFALMLAVFSVQAQEVTFDFRQNTWGFPSGSSSKTPATKTYSNDGYSITVAGGGSSNGHYFNASGYLMNGKKGATLTFPVFNFAVSKIEVVGNKGASSSTEQNIYVDTIPVSTATIGSAGTNVYEIAEAYQAAGNVYILKISSAHNAQYTKINIYKAEGGETPDIPVVETVATPVISAGSTTFNEGESLFVTIETETEGAEIYYTIDGSDPVENGNLYEGEIELTETAIVKAVAMLANWNNSAVADAVFTAVAPNAREFETTISFASTTQRVLQDASKQVWQNEGVTFTNNKASSYSNVADFHNPVRLYTGSNVVVEHEAMTKIEFVCNNSSYATILKESIGDAAIVRGSNVIVVFATPVDEFTVAKLVGQIRLDSLTVTWRKYVKAPTITPKESSGVGDNEVSISAEEGTIYYTLDGTTPTTNSRVYSSPISIYETTTVKAIAVVDGKVSTVAEATCNVIPIVYGPSDILLFHSIGDTVAFNLWNAVVTINTGEHLFIDNRDGENLNLLNSGADYAEGTRFNTGYAVGTVTEDFHGVAQLTNVKFYNIMTSEYTVAIEPREIKITEDMQDLYFSVGRGALVKLKGSSIDNDGYNNDCNHSIIQDGQICAAYDIFDSFYEWGYLGSNCDVIGYLCYDGIILKEISYTLPVSDIGWATLYLDFNAIVPEGVTCYTISENAINNGYIILTEFEGEVLHGGNGVIVKAEPGMYQFKHDGSYDWKRHSILLGTCENTYEEMDAYVLTPDAESEAGVCLGKAIKNQCDGTRWLNNAHRAYLPEYLIPKSAQGAANYSFRFDNGTTGIEEVKGEKAEVKAVFDLTGRRIEEIAAPGIYIVNGVKKLIK